MSEFLTILIPLADTIRTGRDLVTLVICCIIESPSGLPDVFRGLIQGIVVVTRTATTTESPQVAEPSKNEALQVTNARVLLDFIRPGRAKLVLSAFLATFGTICQIAQYGVIALVAGEIMSDEPDERRVWWLTGAMALLIGGRFLGIFASGTLSHLVAFRTLYLYRMNLADRLAKLPLGFFNSNNTGRLKKVMADDVQTMEVYIAHNFPDVVSAFFSVTFGIVVMLAVDWRVGLAATVPIVIAIYIFKGVYGEGNNERMRAYSDSLEKMNSTLMEFIEGLPVIKIFNRTGERFGRAVDAITHYVEFEHQWSIDFMRRGSFFFTFVAANIITVLPVSAYLYREGDLSLTKLVFFLIFALGISTPLMKLMFIMMSAGLMIEGGRRIVSVLEEQPLAEPSEPQHLADHSIAFDNVVFGYNDRSVLKGVSFRAEPGTITALVGPSGSGKTTIARLIPRFWDVASGSVRVGGHDVRDLDSDELLAHVAFVFQENFLFQDTIANNIRFGKPDATNDEVVAAAVAARADDFIRSFPNAYETVLGERGGTLSGGERQRIALARAMIVDAPIVILDEATAFADPENESAIQDAINALVESKTLIVIAHRLSTISHADQILVISDGSIVQRGRHDELVSEPGLYQTMWSDHMSALDWTIGNQESEKQS